MAKPSNKNEPSLDRELKEFSGPGYRSRKASKKISDMRKLRRKLRRVGEKESFESEVKE